MAYMALRVCCNRIGVGSGVALPTKRAMREPLIAGMSSRYSSRAFFVP